MGVNWGVGCIRCNKTGERLGYWGTEKVLRCHKTGEGRGLIGALGV